MIFKVPKPLDRLGIGVDQLPERIRTSKILTGNDLGLLANVEQLPDEQSIAAFKTRKDVMAALAKGEEALHQLAHQYLSQSQVTEAWQILLAKP